MNRILRQFPLLILTGMGLIAVLGAAACDKVPLLAPSGTVINLTVGTDAAALNSSVDIIAVLIENGTSSGGTGTGTGTGTTTAAAGTPVQNGTVVSFTTSIGTIEPAEAKTSNGKVSVKLKTTGESGTATITAYSGGAKSTATVKIGAANVKAVTLTASPTNLPSTGGTATVSARVDDGNGNGVVGVPVTFTTTKGQFSSTTAITNSAGVATTTLTTTAIAEVGAAAGGASSNKVTINVSGRSTVTVSVATGSALAVSTPVSFTVTPGANSSISSATIHYGDGSSKSLGSLGTAQTVIHLYADTGIYDVTVSGTDPDGVVSTGTTQVAIGSLSATMAGTSNSTPANAAPASMTFTVAVDPTAAQIDGYTWNFNDPASTPSNPNTIFTTGKTQNHVFTLPGTYNVTVTVHPREGDDFDVVLVVRIT